MAIMSTMGKQYGKLFISLAGVTQRNNNNIIIAMRYPSRAHIMCPTQGRFAYIGLFAT